MTKKSVVMTLLRMLVGWHLLYEGLSKIFADAGGLDAWGLTITGAALVLGVFVRVSSVCGIALLALDCIAHPGGPAELHSLWVDYRVIMAVMLAAVCFVPSHNIGSLIAAWLGKRLRARDAAADGGSGMGIKSADRRDLLISLSSLPVLGVFGLAFLRRHSKERGNLEARPEAVTSATVKTFEFADLKELKTPNTHFAKIGNATLSRVMLGGNLISGWAHARDLLYTDKLVKAYHSDWRVFKTFQMAEACGINTIMASPPLMRVIGDYREKEGGKIQFISSCGHPDGLVKGAQISVDFGACAIYTHGVHSDRWAQEGNIKAFETALTEMKKLGVPAGIGAHRLETLQFCVEHGLVPDFWMKTFHDTNYWSARPQDGHDTKDNLWCVSPQAVIDFMAQQEQPWIAFKIMAAGAIHPCDAIPFAFRGGADFVCMGMYDFQLVEDVNFFTDYFPTIHPNCDGRTRPWRA
ncbi:MAG: hypothetical protein FWG50_12685 [Kiritimatiellaeota bacterium]|nr:hypothetical protein [Kiritimatiellota bacterium]